MGLTNKRFLTVLCAGVLVAGTTAVQAQQTATDTMAVSASVLPTCSVTANALDFGNLPNLTTQTDVQTTIDLTCPQGATVTVALDAGQNFNTAGGAQYRAMMDNLNEGYVHYNIYQDINRSTPWGDQGLTNGWQTRTVGVPNGPATSVPVYGRVGAWGSVPGGTTYSDSVTVTISY